MSFCHTVLAASVLILLSGGKLAAQVADAGSKIYESFLTPSERYRQVRSLRETAVLLSRDQLVLKEWDGFIRTQINRYNADQSEIVTRNSYMAEQRKRLEGDRQQVMIEKAALNVRRLIDEKFDKSTTAAEFKKSVENYPRLGIVNDNGYFYRFYDAQGVRQGEAASREKEDIRREAERMRNEETRLDKWSSSLADYDRETARQIREMKLQERSTDIKAAQARFQPRFETYQSTQKSFIEEAKRQRDVKAAKAKASEDEIGKVRDALRKELQRLNRPR